MTFLKRHQKIAAFLMGSIIVLSLILLAAANPSQQIGRYRMSAVLRGGFTDIYIIDTVTGVVKYVGKDEGKPFESISGR